MLDRVPPNNINAEIAVLGAMLTPDENVVPIVLPLLTKEDFYNAGHAAIFEAITTLFEADSKIDLLTVTEQLEKDGTFKRTGGVAKINEMIDSVPSVVNVEEYANMVKICSMKRQLIKITAKGYNQAFDDTLEFDDVIAGAEKAILDIRMGKVQNTAIPISKVFKSTVDRLQKISENPDGLLGIATGFHKLDLCIQGIQKGDLTVIAGRPGVGKSILTEQIAVNAAWHCEEPTLLFSLEMPREILGMRIGSSLSEVLFQHVRRGDMSPQEWADIFLVFNELEKVPLRIDDTPGITVEEIRSRCHQEMSKNGLGVVVVDYFQLAKASNKKLEKLDRLEHISESMKNLARSLNVAVVLAAQLNRNVENRPDKRPQLSDIKSCGKLEEDSDVVIGIYRDAAYTKDTNDHSAELIILKQRNGPLDTINLKFDGQRVRFLNC